MADEQRAVRPPPSSFRTSSPVLFRNKQFSRGCAGEHAQRTLSSFLNTCPKLERHALQGANHEKQNERRTNSPGRKRRRHSACCPRRDCFLSGVDSGRRADGG